MLNSLYIIINSHLCRVPFMALPVSLLQGACFLASSLFWIGFCHRLTVAAEAGDEKGVRSGDCSFQFLWQVAVDWKEPSSYEGVHGSFLGRGLCWCVWSVLSPEIMLRSVACADTRGHADVRGAVLSPETMWKSMMCVPADCEGQETFIFLFMLYYIWIFLQWHRWLQTHS